MATLNTPRLGIPYPDGTERVADGDNAMGAIANKIDAGGAPLNAAAGVVSPSMGGSGGINVAVTFPVGRFTQIPVVVASVAAGSNNYFASVYITAKTGFALYVSHRDNTATNTTIPCTWHAVQMTA